MTLKVVARIARLYMDSGTYDKGEKAMSEKANNLYLATITNGDLYRSYTKPHLDCFAEHYRLPIHVFRHIMSILLNKAAKELARAEGVTWYISYPLSIRREARR